MTDNIIQGRSFEDDCCQLLQQLGFHNCQQTSTNTDHGADIQGDYSSTRYVFQCKNHKKPVGNNAVQEAVAAKAIYSAGRCGVISKGRFTSPAYQLAEANNCMLFTFSELAEAFASGKTFGDLIQGYKFNNIEPVAPDHDLIKIYEETKNKLGHTPRNKDFDPSTRYRIIRRYGSLSNLIENIGDPPYSIRPTDQVIKSEYKRIRKIVLRTPTLDDMRQHSCYSRNCFAAYPFTRLQRECGDTPNVERNVPKQAMIDAFRTLQDTLGRIPTQRDIDERGKYRVSYYRKQWGNYDAFLEELGIGARAAKQRSYSEAELAIMFLLLKKAFEIRDGSKDFSLNHTVLQKLKYGDGAFVSPSTFSKRFGSWSAFLSFLSHSSYSEFSNSLDEMIRGILDRRFGDQQQTVPRTCRG